MMMYVTKWVKFRFGRVGRKCVVGRLVVGVVPEPPVRPVVVMSNKYLQRNGFVLLTDVS